MDERQAAVERLKAREAEAQEHQIDDEVEAERSRKRRAAADDAERQRQANGRAEIGKEADTMMKALAEAESVAVTMAAQLREAFAAANQINRVAVGLGLRGRMSPGETADRLSKRLSMLLAGIHSPTHFGGLLLDTHLIDPKASWEADERHHAPWLAEFDEGERK